MRSVVVLFSILVIGACRTVAPASEPTARPAAESTLADLLAAAAAPEMTAELFAPYIARVDGQASVTFGEVRALIRENAWPDGRFVYEVEEYVPDPLNGETWHVLRVVFEQPDIESVRAADFAFVARDGALRMRRLSR